MNKLKDIIAYFCLKYPFGNELSKARLTKLVYLADWVSALADGKQLTNVEWVFNHYGPYVDDIVHTARSDDNFKIVPSLTFYGSEKEIVEYVGTEENIVLEKREKEILDAVINKTKSMYFNDFMNYIYSTYPVRSKERYSFLDLVKLAQDYKETQKQCA